MQSYKGRRTFWALGHNGKRQVFIKGTGILISDGHYIIMETNLAAAIRKIGIGLAGIGRFSGYTLWYYYTIYRVISDMHWVLRGGN